jgi:hypothetical protein
MKNNIEARMTEFAIMALPEMCIRDAHHTPNFCLVRSTRKVSMLEEESCKLKGVPSGLLNS